MTNLLILTCARSGLVEAGADPWLYLRETVEQIHAEGCPLNRMGVLCDGKYSGPALPENWELFEFDKTTGDAPTTLAGNKWAFWRLLEVGRDMGGDLIALEDDLFFCSNAVRRIATFQIPRDLSWVQFFSPSILGSEYSPVGLWRPPGGSGMFLQAVKFTERALRALVDFKHSNPLWTKYSASDTALAVVEHELGLRYGVHSPDLVQHRGEMSEANPMEKGLDKWRRSACWPGQSFDALTLYRRDDVYR